jgi:hypothetical protein
MVKSAEEDQIICVEFWPPQLPHPRCRSSHFFISRTSRNYYLPSSRSPSELSEWASLIRSSASRRRTYGRSRFHGTSRTACFCRVEGIANNGRGDEPPEVCCGLARNRSEAHDFIRGAWKLEYISLCKVWRLYMPHGAISPSVGSHMHLEI